MRYYLKSLILLASLLMLLNTTAEAQFDSIIFARNDIYYRESVVYLGDQNDDGCDDFLLCTYYAQNGLSGEALLFYGGNPINPVPAMAFKFVGAVSYSVTACDYNRDGYRDIFVTTYRSKPLKFKVFRRPCIGYNSGHGIYCN